MQVFRNMDTRIFKNYIIRLDEHPGSCDQAEECAASSEKFNMEWEYWPAFNGLNKQDILVPEKFKGKDWLKWFKVSNNKMTIPEVSVFFSHLSLWIHCLNLNQPLVVCEHDCIWLKEYKNHVLWNAINYLGGSELLENQFADQPTPPFGTLGTNGNWRFMNRTHCYSICPSIASRLVAHTLKFGIQAVPDITMNADLFTIYCPGLYAYDNGVGTTVTDRSGKNESGSAANE